MERVQRRAGTRRTAIATALIIVAYLALLIPQPSFRVAAVATDHLDMVNSVDGYRMTSTITDLQEFGARAYFLTSMLNASAYIHDRFAELGLWVTYQDFVVRGYPQRNVIAVLNGTDAEAPQYLFGAHYDSLTIDLVTYEEGDPAIAPGADDDASGVAATIELATILHDKKFNSTVKFVAFGAEETGLNGSQVFVQREVANGVSYAGTTIMDMIGYRASDENKAFIFRGDYTNRMAESLQGAVDSYGLSLSLTLISGRDMSSSDHFPFWLAGYSSMLVIEELMDGWPVNPYYHTENDTVDHISSDQMTAITKAVLGGFLGLQEPADEKDRSAVNALWSIAAVVAVVSVIIIAAYIIRNRKGIR